MSISTDRMALAENISSEAGKLLLQMFKNRAEIKNQLKGVSDIVTEADLKAEELIVNRIKQNFPDDKIISEEKDADLEHTSATSENYSWIIDPLDGTRNFSIGNPNFVVSIGILKGKELIGGVVYFPVLDEYYIAEGGKAFHDNTEVKVNSTRLDNAIVGFWDKREKDPNYSKVDILNKLRGKVKVLRMFGASALEKSWVASGQIDLYIGNSSSIFGAAAGVALIRGAGGIVLNLEGEEWKFGDVGIICGEKQLVIEALSKLSRE